MSNPRYSNRGKMLTMTATQMTELSNQLTTLIDNFVMQEAADSIEVRLFIRHLLAIPTDVKPQLIAAGYKID